MKKSAPILVFCVLSACLTALSSASVRFADAAAKIVSDPLRRLLASLSSPFPFPLFEVAVVLLPAVLLFAAIRGVRRGSDPSVYTRRAFSLAGILLSLTLLLAVLPARRAVPADPAPPSDGELVSFADWLAERANAEARFLPASDREGTPPAFPSTSACSRGVTALLCDAGLCPISPVRVKATLFPGLLRRMGLLGYHASWTGEAVIDPRAPAYTVPFTAAHEAAHQAGILSEGEASYIAYLSLLSSSDPALRYAAVMGALDAVLPLIKSGEQKRVVSTLSECVRADLSLYDRLLASGKAAGTVAGANETAVRLRGGEDRRSYDLFPILACRRYLARSAGDADAAPAIY